MKKTLIMLAATSSVALATSVTVTNNRGPVNTREIFDNSGNPLGAGFAAIGVLDEAAVTDQLASLTSINFVQFGNAAGALDAQGRITPSITDNVNIDSAEGAPFRSQSVYLVVADNSDFAAATEAFIYKFDTTFGDADAGAPINLNLTAADSTGSTLFGVENLTGPTGGQNFQTLVLVPEPSTSLLATLAGLGLIARRRR